MGQARVARLTRTRELLAVKGYDTRNTVLACYSAAGFDAGLREMATADPAGIQLIDPDRMYDPVV